MYLSTYEERDNGSFYEEGYDGRNLSKLNLCEEGKLRTERGGEHHWNHLVPWDLIYLITMAY